MRYRTTNPPNFLKKHYCTLILHHKSYLVETNRLVYRLLIFDKSGLQAHFCLDCLTQLIQKIVLAMDTLYFRRR
jgi:hypothetical protein